MDKIKLTDLFEQPIIDLFNKLSDRSTNSIYITSWGSYIDLARIISVSEIQGHGTWSYFTIDFQLREKPMIVPIWNESGCTVDKMYSEFSFKTRKTWEEFVLMLRDEIIMAWKRFKGEAQ